MKFISQMFNSTDKSLENEMQLLMLLTGWLVILHIFVHPNNICGGSSVHLYSEEQSYIRHFGKNTRSSRLYKQKNKVE